MEKAVIVQILLERAYVKLLRIQWKVSHDRALHSQLAEVEADILNILQLDPSYIPGYRPEGYPVCVYCGASSNTSNCGCQPERNKEE
jgi:hypothetical protein